MGFLDNPKEVQALPRLKFNQLNASIMLKRDKIPGGWLWGVTD